MEPKPPRKRQRAPFSKPPLRSPQWLRSWQTRRQPLSKPRPKSSPRGSWPRSPPLPSKTPEPPPPTPVYSQRPSSRSLLRLLPSKPGLPPSMPQKPSLELALIPARFPRPCKPQAALQPQRISPPKQPTGTASSLVAECLSLATPALLFSRCKVSCAPLASQCLSPAPTTQPPLRPSRSSKRPTTSKPPA